MCLQALHRELLEWPFLNEEETLDKGQTASYAEVTDTGEEPGDPITAVQSMVHCEPTLLICCAHAQRCASSEDTQS